jgi:actin-related protein
MYADDEIGCIVVDTGTTHLIGGFAGEDVPRACPLNLYGKIRMRAPSVSLGQKHYYVGDEAWKNRGCVLLKAGWELNWDEKISALYDIHLLHQDPIQKPLL